MQRPPVHRFRLVFAIASLALAVGATPALAEQLAPSAPPPAAKAPTPPPAVPPAQPAKPAAPPKTNPQVKGPVTLPTISTEAGDPNGVIVLWPRVIPSATADARDPIAISAQARLSGLVAQTLPGKPITLRPKPQRVCPQGGCAGLSVGVLIAHVQGGCAAAALIGGPGRSARRIIPWAGRMELKALQYPFRGQPESLLSLKEMVKCEDLVRSMGERDAAVAEALKFAYRAHMPKDVAAP